MSSFKKWWKLNGQGIGFIVGIVYLNAYFLLLGDRGPVAQLGLMIIGAYSIYFKRIGFLFFSSIHKMLYILMGGNAFSSQ